MKDLPTNDIYNSVGTTETKFSVYVTKKNTKFYLSLNDSGTERYFCANKTEILIFKNM